MPETGLQAWEDALEAIRIARAMATGRHLPGLRIKAGAADVTQTLLEEMQAAFYPLPFFNLPASISVHDLTGSLDLTRTLASRKAIWQTGVLERASDGYLVLEGGERIESQALHYVLEHVSQGRIGLVVIDRSQEGDESLSARLVDHLTFHLDLSMVSRRDVVESRRDVDGTRVTSAKCERSALQMLCNISLKLGLSSMRPPSQAASIARAHAGLAGRDEVNEEDISTAVRLSLLHRAVTFPVAEETVEADREKAFEGSNAHGEAVDPELLESNSPEPVNLERGPPQEMNVAVENIKLPHGLVTHVLAGLAKQSQPGGGQQGAKPGRDRGRPLPSRKGRPGRDGRIDLFSTLKAAAPWQEARRNPEEVSRRLRVYPNDLHVKRYREAAENLTVFAVDASGSTALNRLGEAKGAVEFLLAESYVTRDRVALVSFRSEAAEVLLPPTRSLARAKRSLSNLQGGGGTPLADGLRLSLNLLQEQLRSGSNVSFVLLTDGSANIALDGERDRKTAMQDAHAVARQFRSLPVSVVLLDVGRAKTSRTVLLAESLGARHVSMPFSSARNIVSQLSRTA